MTEIASVKKTKTKTERGYPILLFIINFLKNEPWVFG